MPLQTPPRPAAHSGEWDSILLFTGAMGVTLMGWLLGWVAAAAAGGAPKAGPFQFLQNLIDALLPKLPAVAGSSTVTKVPLTWWNVEGITRPMNTSVFWLVIFALAALIVAAVGVVTYNLRGGLPNINWVGGLRNFQLGSTRTPPHTGDGAWATMKDLRRFAVASHNPDGRRIMGTYQGKVLAVPKEDHVILFAPTGGGKTSSYAIPAALEHRGPAVIFTVKEDLAKATAGRRQRLGHVLFYDPTNATPQFSNRLNFNVVEGCKDIQEAMAIGPLIGAGAEGETASSDGEFNWWKRGRDALLSAYLCAAAWAGVGMETVREWVNTNNFSAPVLIVGGDELHNEFMDWYVEHFYETAQWEAEKEGLRVPSGSAPSRIADPSQRAQAWELLMKALRRNPRQAESMLEMAKSSMSIWLNPHALASADPHRPNFSVEEFLGGANTIYVVAPGTEQSKVAGLNVALVMKIWRTISAMESRGEALPNPPVLFLFDEMANICPLPDFHQLISTCRGLNIRIMSIWQDLSQIEDRYGEARAGTILNNHRCSIALPGMKDKKTADYFAALAGSRKVAQVSRTRGSGSDSTSVGESVEQMIDIGSLRRIPENQALCIYGASKPFIVDQRRYFNTPWLLKLAETPYLDGIGHYREGADEDGPGDPPRPGGSMLPTAHGLARR